MNSHTVFFRPKEEDESEKLEGVKSRESFGILEDR